MSVVLLDKKMTFQLVSLFTLQLNDNIQTKTSNGLFSKTNSIPSNTMEFHISAVELCQNNLYIGTTQGQLLHYTLSTLPQDEDHINVCIQLINVNYDAM